MVDATSAQRLLAEHQDLLEEIHLQQERSGQGGGWDALQAGHGQWGRNTGKGEAGSGQSPRRVVLQAGLQRGGVTKDWSGILHTLGRDLGQSLSFLEHSIQSRPGHTPCR